MMHQTTMTPPAVVDTVMSSSSSTTMTMLMEVSNSSSSSTTTTTGSTTGRSNNGNALPSNYIPGNWDVICQRGKDCHEHIGNRRFRICVENHVDSYLNAKTRLDKSNVITSVVCSIKESSNHEAGGFIMKDTKTNQWYHVDNKVARDKAGNALRDAVKQRLESSDENSSSDMMMMFSFTTTFPPPSSSPQEAPTTLPPTSSPTFPPPPPPPRQVSQDSFFTMKQASMGHHQQQQLLPHCFPSSTRNEQFALLDTPMFTLDQEQQCTANLLGDLPDSFDMLMELPTLPPSITSSSGW